MVQLREDVVGLDSSIIMHPKVWEASGHIAGFNDPLIECAKCGLRIREDKIEEEGRGKCPKDKKEHEFGEPRMFNLMFKTHLGPIQKDENVVYLRPETAQGIFCLLYTSPSPRD